MESGTDICFPGDQLVTLANVSQKALRYVIKDDNITSLDTKTHQACIVTVKELVVHTPKNYAITQLHVMHADQKDVSDAHIVMLSGKILKVTPNHPALTVTGKKQMGEVVTGDQLLCMDENTKTFRTYIVVNKTEAAGDYNPCTTL